MHVFSKKILRQFWTLHPDAETPLRAWFRKADRTAWEKFADVRASCSDADQVGPLTDFNIGGNKYRLIAAIHYNTGCVFIQHVLTHSEYDTDKWKKQQEEWRRSREDQSKKGKGKGKSKG